MSDFRLKCTKFAFHWVSTPTRWGSLQRSPDLLAVFKEPTSKGKGVERKGRRREGKREGRGEEGEGRREEERGAREKCEA